MVADGGPRVRVDEEAVRNLHLGQQQLVQLDGPPHVGLAAGAPLATPPRLRRRRPLLPKSQAELPSRRLILPRSRLENPEAGVEAEFGSSSRYPPGGVHIRKTLAEMETPRFETRVVVVNRGAVGKRLLSIPPPLQHTRFKRWHCQQALRRSEPLRMKRLKIRLILSLFIRIGGETWKTRKGQ